MLLLFTLCWITHTSLICGCFFLVSLANVRKSFCNTSRNFCTDSVLAFALTNDMFLFTLIYVFVSRLSADTPRAPNPNLSPFFPNFVLQLARTCVSLSIATRKKHENNNGNWFNTSVYIVQIKILFLRWRRHRVLRKLKGEDKVWGVFFCWFLLTLKQISFARNVKWNTNKIDF